MCQLPENTITVSIRKRNTTSGDEHGMMATSQIGQIEPFEIGSGDWELYAERLEQFLLANGIDDDKKSRSLLQS